MKKFWNWKEIKNEAPEDDQAERVLELYGTIAEESWFDDDITPGMFREELFSGTGPVTIWINSPGGDCFAASQIYTMLMDYKGPITVKIDGIAASAASVIAMAGTEVLMSPTAMLMIHNPATIAFGDHQDMEKAIDMLNEVKESIINAYELKTSQPRKTLSKMMDEETWMNAKKAVEMGFADAMLEDSKRSPDPEAFSFSASAVERALINKISEKAAPKEPVKPGRNIDDLKASLYKKLL
jgi:ATP-dependent Clp protease protease subunit